MGLICSTHGDTGNITYGLHVISKSVLREDWEIYDTKADWAKPRHLLKFETNRANTETRERNSLKNRSTSKTEFVILIYLTPWYRTFLGLHMIKQPLKKVFHFMDHRRLFPCLQKPTSISHSEPDDSSPFIYVFL